MSLLDALSLFVIMTMLAAIPSSSVALVVTRSATAGGVNGAAVAAGIVLGDLMFVVLALLGMATLAEVMGNFFMVLRYLGGAYLIWFGFGLLRAKPTSDFVVSNNSTSSLSVSFVSGLLLTLGDIKAILFYASLFPGFVDMHSLNALDVALVFVLTILAVGGVKLAYACAARKVVSLARDMNLTCGARKSAGGLMMGAGAYLIAKA